MCHFEYIPKKELAPIRDELISIIKETQNLLRNEFTFRFDFVGSYKRNMVTYDPTSNVGFDFDVNLEVNDDNKEYSAKEIKHKIIWALNRVAWRYGYDHAEDSTRVITIKVKDRLRSRILYSCDFAIVNNYTDSKGRKRQEYIRYNKRQQSYTWEEQTNGYYLLHKKANRIKNGHRWGELRELYQSKKDRLHDSNKHSRSLYAEAVHEICQKHGFYN